MRGPCYSALACGSIEGRLVSLATLERSSREQQEHWS